MNSPGCPQHPDPAPLPQCPQIRAWGGRRGLAVTLGGPRWGRGRRPDWGDLSPIPHEQQNNSHPPPPPPRGLSGAFVLAGRAGGARLPPPPAPERPARRRLPSRSRKHKEAEGVPLPPRFAPLREPRGPQYLPRREGAGAGPLLGGLPRAGAARRAGCGRIRGPPGRQPRRRRRAPLAPPGSARALAAAAAAAASGRSSPPPPPPARAPAPRAPAGSH